MTSEPLMMGRREAMFGSLAAGMVGMQTPPPGVPGQRLPMPDPTETIDLWPGTAPGLAGTPPVEKVVERSSDPANPDRYVAGIARPRLVVFRPAKPNGAALMVAPGGGYVRIVLDKEGYEIGRWLSARGWTVFVLFYRLPGEGWRAPADTPLADAQRAMRLIRARAATYGVDPAKVAAMGFSAGGHVCGDLATRFAASVYKPVDDADRLSARPDLAAPIYAVQSMRSGVAHPGSREMLVGKNATPAAERAHSVAENVTRDTPPCFLVHAEDDGTVPVDNTLQMRAALKAAGVQVDTHLFAEGGHGFGLKRAAGKPAAMWPELFAAWAKKHGIG